MKDVGSDFLCDGAGLAAALLRALGNEHRLWVLCLLSEHGELSAGQILLRVSLRPSALSQHLERMRSEGLIDHRRQADEPHYRITHPAVAEPARCRDGDESLCRCSGSVSACCQGLCWLPVHSLPETHNARQCRALGCCISVGA